MCIDFYGHHSGGSSFCNKNDFLLLQKLFQYMDTTGTSSALRKNRSMSPSI